MKVAFIIYNEMTTLDFIGAYDALTRLKTMKFIQDFEWEICAFTKQVVDGSGLRIAPTRVGGTLEDFDLIIVPGGYGTRGLVSDPDFMAWLKTSESCKLKASVCTGSV